MDTNERVRLQIYNKLRKDKKTQVELSKKIGRSASHINQILTGERAKIPNSLIEIAAGVGLQLTLEPIPEHESSQEDDTPAHTFIPVNNSTLDTTYSPMSY